MRRNMRPIDTKLFQILAKATHMTSAEIAQETGYSEGYIRQIWTDRRKLVSEEFIIRFSKYFNDKIQSQEIDAISLLKGLGNGQESKIAS